MKVISEWSKLLVAYSFIEATDDLLYAPMFSDKIDSLLWPDAPDGITVVTAQQYTQIDELKQSRQLRSMA